MCKTCRDIAAVSGTRVWVNYPSISTSTFLYWLSSGLLVYPFAPTIMCHLHLSLPNMRWALCPQNLPPSRISYLICVSVCIILPVSPPFLIPAFLSFIVLTSSIHYYIRVHQLRNSSAISVKAFIRARDKEGHTKWSPAWVWFASCAPVLQLKLKPTLQRHCSLILPVNATHPIWFKNNCLFLNQFPSRKLWVTFTFGEL